jgi:hypothetical protein
MIRKLLVLSLCVVPAVAFGQEARPAACRTLEAAGGFVGPDEIIVNGLVCPKAMGTDDAQQPANSVPGVVVSDGATINVVAAAKAANQRVAAAENAIKQKAEAAQDQSQPAPVVAPILTTAAPEQQQEPSSPAPALTPQNTDSKTPDAANASNEPEAITDPVVNDAIGSFSDAMEKVTSRDSQPAADSEPTLSAQKNVSHSGAETQPCAKNSASSTKCVDVIGQVAEDLGHL